MAKLNKTETGIADLGQPRIIVIGGGFGGIEVINGLKHFKGQVVLFDRYNHHCFQPLLYQVATSGLESSSIIFPFRRKFSQQENFYFRLGEVTKIKPEENYIETSIGGINYDYLIIANGATTNFYGMQDIEANASPMKTIIDSIKLRNITLRNLEKALLTSDPEVMNSLMDFVIVGGGPTGVELAGALAELKNHVFPKDYPELDLSHMDIHLIESNGKLLNGMSEKSSAKALEYLLKMGVKVHLNCAVKSYDGHDVVINTGEKLITKCLIWAAGVKGMPIDGIDAKTIGRGSRIMVDEFNRVKGYNNVFAIGDAALMEGDPSYPNGHPQMAQPAIQQGRLLAKNLQRIINNKPLKPFRYNNLGAMATIGRNKAVVDLPSFKTQGWFAWCIWMFVHLISLMGFKNKFFVFLSWLVSYFSYDKSNRLIVSRPKDGD